MRVIICEASRGEEQLLIDGIQAFLESVAPEPAPTPTCTPVLSVAPEPPVVALAIAPAAPEKRNSPIKPAVKKRAVRELKGKKPAPVKTSTEPEKGRVTIQARILGLLSAGKKTASEVSILMRRAGLSADIDYHQHLYNAKGAGRVRLDSDGFYELTPVGEAYICPA